MLRPALHWLDQAPVRDPVDRRNARVVQALLIFMGITIPVMLGIAVWMTLPYFAQGDVHWSTYASLGMSASVAISAWLGLLLIRRGAFRVAVQWVIAVMLLVSTVNLAVNGLQRQAPDQLAQMLVLILSGLVLGRRALWTTWCVLVLGVALGAGRDAIAHTSGTAAQAFFNILPLGFSYLLVALLIDRTTEALRETLRESNARGERLAEEMLQREKTHAQLIHAQKKEIAERMATGMAHDFNNIFAIIAGFSAQRHNDDGGSHAARAAELHGALESVEESARRGMAISRRLLRFSRSDVRSPQWFDVDEAIGMLQGMLRQLLGPEVQLSLEGGAQSAQVMMDRSEFELMLLNIASNAGDAMDGSGQFRITTAFEQDGVTITLQDNGHGMPAHVAERVFEPFFSTKPADSGTGLGMAVVRELVDYAQGSIAVESAVAVGTTYRMRLPAVRGGPGSSPGHAPR
ncbi:sensor histidine kinase [Stenotrophomonas sp. NPDC077659]|uniref:sensor histidine kinase n=1 Tax=Stenotrophomonas sp. NPDC077659 TaxID=3390694 RepID=UPI003CFC0AE5